eukprot:gnl/Hemi2/21541_TR7174_c0_g1_i1.p2 gnl/Hemi2/21541_TR7174_c0_g1~~gnl/Hemi2/21541_TR7174_c0_g1_i1.p2  ORF type:complete len:230 (-),score=81.81 gnl/Hemi2/21541_TR7174_c0_g1_i1:97-723(-)
MSIERTHFDAIMQDAVANLLRNATSDDGWKKKKEVKKGVQLYTKEQGVPDGWHFAKGVGRVHAPIDAVIALLMDTTPANRQKWDPMFLSIREIQAFDSNNLVTHTTYKSPSFMVTARDMCSARSVIRNPDQTIFCVQSIEHPGCPPASGFVRAQGSGGFILRDAGGGVTDVINVVGFNPQGSIPGFIIKGSVHTKPLQIAEFDAILRR